MGPVMRRAVEFVREKAMELPPGTLMPSMDEMANASGISSRTIMYAFAHLGEEGVLVKGFRARQVLRLGQSGGLREGRVWKVGERP